jgi:hypothetical protein
MTNQITEDIVKQFITQLKTQWDNLVVEYRYDADEDVWDIWHFNYGLQYNDMNFQKAVGKLIRTLFFDQGIFNISFGYKHLPEFSTAELVSIKPSSVTVGDSISVEWLGGLQNKPNSLAYGGGKPARNIYRYTADSALLCNYDYEPGTSNKIGTTTINGEVEVLVA